jgi:hypothetical protein
MEQTRKVIREKLAERLDHINRVELEEADEYYTKID